MEEIQKKSKKILEKLPLPTGKYGLNIEINPGFDFSKIKKEISNPKIDIKSQEAIISQKITPKEKQFFSKDFNDDSYEYHLLTANANNFLVINIPKELKKPIEIDQEITEQTISFILILAEPNSKAQILLKKTGKADIAGDDIRVIAKENAKLDIITLQNLDPKTINIQRRNSAQKKDSEVNWVDVCLGTSYTKSDVIGSLNEPGAIVNNKVIYLANKSQKFDIYTASIHNAPDTSSDIVTKGVLNDNAKALSRGLVKINKNAPGSNGYETQDALLLSNKAEADAIPNLEINNNDVKCSHGSTVGQVDEDKLFYLMTRGLTKDEASQKIVEGYFTPVLDMFHDPNIKEQVHKTILEGLS